MKIPVSKATQKAIARSVFRSERDELRAEVQALKVEREQMREAIEQALDDMGENGLSVCQQAKEMLQASLAVKERHELPTSARKPEL